MELKAFAVSWTNTNNRGILGLPKLCNILKIIAENAQDAAEIAAFKVTEMIIEQFPNFHCDIKTDEKEPYKIFIEITENGSYVGKIYNFDVIE